MSEISWPVVLGATALGAVISALVSATVAFVNAWRDRIYRAKENALRIAWEKEMLTQRAGWEQALAKLRADAETSLQTLRRGWDLEDRQRAARQEQKKEIRTAVSKWIIAMKNGAMNTVPTGAEAEAITQANADLQFRLPQDLEKLRIDFQLFWSAWITNKPPIVPDNAESIFPPPVVSSAYEKFLLGLSR